MKCYFLILYCIHILQFVVFVDCKSYLRFQHTQQVVEEINFNPVVVLLSRTGDLTGELFITCQLPSHAGNDFHSLSAAASFVNQSGRAECRFLIKNDDVPEGNETFKVTVSPRNSENVHLISPNETYITILPNDDPYGCVAFTNLRKYEDVEEPENKQLSLTFEVKRYGGRIGDTSVFWQLSPLHDVNYPDFSATLGFVHFLEGEISKILQLDVLPDQLPEPREIYMLRLMNASGGVCIWDNSSEIEIRIKENDAPIRFMMSSMVFTEPEKKMVSILRGINADGTRIGPIADIATVHYKTLSGTAHKGVDYIHKEGVITFEVGTTKKDLEIEVLSDPKPELMENFTVLLTSVSSNVILSEPRQLEIMISKNDHPHGLVKFLNETASYIVLEDSLGSVTVSVVRMKGLYGNVNVSWVLESTEIDPAIVFHEGTGFVSFSSNQSEAKIILSVLKNDIPSEAVEFNLVLRDASGGVTILTDVNGNHPSVKVIVRDNDDAYGVFKFSGEAANLILSSTPRRIESKLQRSGGALSDVEVSYSINYYHKESSVPLPSILIKERNGVIMKKDEKELVLVAEIRNDVFLKAGSYFIIKLNGVNLTKSTLIPPLSPSIGIPNRMYVNITANVANGEIGFFGVPISIQISEPMHDNKMKNISLKIMRDGTASNAKIFWRLRSENQLFTKEDASPMNGFVTFQRGIGEVNITLKILSDQVPELDELFFVELFNTTGRNEKLRKDATKAYVTIQKNDNPGGVIEFENDSPVVIKESSNTVLYLQRYGGMLEPKTVLVKIEQGADDFTSFNQFITFNQGKSKEKFYLFPIDDDKPELNETFTVTLDSVKGTVLGNKTHFAVTILENDDPYGLISFSNNPANINQHIGEVPNFQTEVKFQVSRSKGTFGNIQVFWKISTSVNGDNPSLDLNPTSGTVVLNDGQNTNTFSVYVKRDKVPEDAEEFEVNITNVIGGASLVFPSRAKLTINANDFPVTISPLTIHVDEGNSATVTIKINKTFSQSIRVSVKTIFHTADSGDFIPIDEVITFLPGEKQRSIQIRTINDETPELDEMFTIQLLSTTGDTVLWKDHSADIIINANDDPHGVFEFAAIENKVVNEGEPVKLRVQRSKGLYGNVSLTWQAMNESGIILDTFEVSQSVGTIRFMENQSIGEIEFIVKKDGIPELNETFYVHLMNVSGGLSRIGNHTRLKILILSNDYPNGLFVFADMGTTSVYGEDVYTEGNITLKRLQGNYGTAKIIWEIHKSNENISTKIWDLFSRGNSSNLLQVTGRELTSTKAFRFVKGSCLTVPTLRQPKEDDLLDGFTYGVFFKFKTSSNFTFLTKKLNTDTLLTISVESWVRASLKILFSDENSNTQTISVILPVNVMNKDWHSFFVTFFLSGNIIVYFNGDKIVTKSISGLSPIFKSAGTILVGCDERSSNIYLQDFRIYPEALNAKVVAYFSMKESAFSVFNGEITFIAGEIQKSIHLQTLNDDIPEPNTLYTIKILDVIDKMPPRDRAVVSKKNGTKVLKVLKSDYANGVFHLIEETCSNNLSESAIRPWNISVKREKGLFDKVLVGWEIRNNDGDIARRDFVNATGHILFLNNQSIQQLSIYPLDDDIPENHKVFTFKLVSVQSGDDLFPFSSKNGASINTNQSQCPIGILENDFPYGVFQIMEVIPSTGSFIPPLSHALKVKITEEQGVFHAFIVRAQGLTGTVSVEWKTEGATAVGGIDYVENVGSVNLKPGQRSARLTIQIIDNHNPELTKEFRIVLRNPTGRAVLGKASSMNIQIRPSDNAMGVFSFVETNVTATEGSPLNLTIHRTGGTLGDVVITWKILHGGNDFLNESGIVYMRRREITTTVSLFVVSDKIPELTEVYKIMIFNLSDGSINETADTTFIRIPPNDYPYGLFNFRDSLISIPEESKTLSVSVVRTKGLSRAVRVHYNVSGTLKAIENKDFEIENNYVDFNEGDIEKFIFVKISDDKIPEIDESFTIQLINSTLLNENQEWITEKMIGRNDSVTVTINSNDYAHGILEFESSIVNITEEDTNPVVNVSRKQGLFGKISFRFMVKSISAAIGVDFTVNTLEVVMSDGQQFAQLPIFMVDDSIPEFEEDFTVFILPETIRGGAVAGTQLSCRYIILESDFPYGLIGFSSHSILITTSEPNSAQGNQVVLEVLREGGVHGPTQVLWEVTPSNTDDIFPTQGRVGFLTGEKMQQITIDVRPDDIPEFNETFKIELVNVNIGKASINPHKTTAHLIIWPNDDPYGIINFSHANLTVIEEESDTVVFIPVERLGGWFGDLKVYYRTQEIEISNQHKADGNNDFKWVTDGSIVLKNGSIYGQLKVSILNDTIPELDETFQVKLIRVELIGIDARIENQPKIGAKDVVNITIAENDQPYGLLQLSLDSNVKEGSDGTYMIQEPESNNLPMQFTIVRQGGMFNVIMVSWRLAHGYTISPGLDISGSDGATITFQPNEQRKSFSITINQDNIPEDNEVFAIELYNPTNGAVLDLPHSRVTITISGNDKAGGIIGFRAGSISVSANEGQQIKLHLERTHSFLGRVVIQWRINGLNAEEDFSSVTGYTFMEPGDRISEISFNVKVDLKPEPDEQFTVDLVSINTTGISKFGAAILSPTSSRAYIALGASNDPHGVIEFSLVTQPVHVMEDSGEVQLLLVRRSGKIGQIQIFYEIQPFGNDSLARASILDDIQVTTTSVYIQDQMDSVQIQIPIVNDNIPEVDEAFRIMLKSVQLINSPMNTSSVPKLGNLKVVDIIIDANDGTRGELVFAPHSINPYVKEYDHAFNLTVIRSLGAFGDVYCFYYLNRLNASLKDFHVNGGVIHGGPAKLYFKDGETKANITVFIKDDTLTEDLEQFEIGLTIQNAVNNGGVAIGDPSRTTISILPNDDANGVMQFKLQSQNVLLEEPNENPGAKSTHTFVVERNAGWFGRVLVGWQIKNHSKSDVRPLSGVLEFEPYDREESFYLMVIDDDLPELQGILLVEISIISGGASLGSPSQVAIVIAASDYPHGLFSFKSYPELIMDESSVVKKITVARDGGSYGNVAVKFKTRPGSAKSIRGNNLKYVTEYLFNFTHLYASCQIKAFDNDLLFISSAKNVKVFIWKGTYLKLKEYPIPNITKMSTSQIGQKQLVVMSNTSHVLVYILEEMLNLNHVQTISDSGISDSLLFQMQTNTFIGYTIGKDARSETIKLLQLFKWNGYRFTQHSSSLQTFYGQTLDFVSVNDTEFLVIGNKFNRITNNFITKSYFYLLLNDGNFQLYGEITTSDLKELKFFKMHGQLYVGAVNGAGHCELYIHKVTRSTRFELVQNFGQLCSSMNMISFGNEDFIIVSVKERSHVYKYNALLKLFIEEQVMNFQLAPKQSPLFITNQSDNTSITYFMIGSHTSNQLARLVYQNSSSDFFERSGMLEFDQYVTELDLFFTIFDDHLPEPDEFFYIDLSNATNGAALSPIKSTLRIMVMANDNAYGRIEFLNSSLHRYIKEEDYDTVFTLQLIRKYGSYGVVTVHYTVTNIKRMYNFQSEIYPKVGSVQFLTSEVTKDISLYLKGDSIPELAEHFAIRLTGISTLGKPDSHGASINYMKDEVFVTIPPNDDPYGVFSWKSVIQVSTEYDETNSSVLLVITRQKGAFGDVTVFYETYVTNQVGFGERAAKPFIDFIPVSGNVTFHDGVREQLVFINITHSGLEKIFNLIKDGRSDFNEVFYVNLTKAKLVSHTNFSMVVPLVDSQKRSVQVVITDAVQNNGVVQFQTEETIMVDENVGILQIPIERTHGSDGIVAVYFDVVFKSASDLDVTPHFGTVSFNANETLKMLNITIQDDDIPEFAENFSVILTKPVGGVVIGGKNEIQIEIKKNDYPYGLFSISMGSRQIKTFEGDRVAIIVERLYGAKTDVSVTWHCGSKARNEITITSGIITFQEDEKQKVIQFNVIDDSIPELKQIFTCVLTNVTSEGQLSNHRQATITIGASDKPFGVFELEKTSRDLFVAEGGNVSISVLRDVGQQASVTVSWNLQNLFSMVNNTATTFSLSSGVLKFPPGMKKQVISLQVLTDSIPEEAQQYELFLHSPTGGGELNVNKEAITSSITVISNGNPYGIFRIKNEKQLSVDEDVGSVNIVVERSGGSIGTVLLKFSVRGHTALPEVDYSPAEGYLVFDHGDVIKSIIVDVINDDIPEVQENFLITLDVVNLNKSISFNKTRSGVQVNVPPLIDGLHARVNVSITENDDPYGMIEFVEAVMIVHEWQLNVDIPVVRSGGLFDSSSVEFTYTPVSATYTSDFTIDTRPLIFSTNQNTSFIRLTLIDDVIPEDKETFFLYLKRVIGKARLGNHTKLTVVIETSDNPYGLLGFYNTSNLLRIQNPMSVTDVKIPVTRLAGTKDMISIEWEITRVQTSASHVTEDLTPSKGSIQFNDKQDGSKEIRIAVLPYGGPQEAEESFVLSLTKADGGASIDGTASKVTIIIGKKGFPSGLFSLQSIQPTASVDEPIKGSNTVKIVVHRKFGRVGSVNVKWSITSPTGDITADIHYAQPQIVTFVDNQVFGYILINITADDYPELEEEFYVSLVSADQEGEIDETKNQKGFSIKANGDPHGVFSLVPTKQQMYVDATNMTRTLQISITRTAGLMDMVTVTLSVEHIAMVKTKHNVYFVDGQAESSLDIQIPDNAFLQFPSRFSVQLLDVKLTNATRITSPVLSINHRQTFVQVPEYAANSIVQITNSSLFVSVNQVNQAVISVERSGLYGDMRVQWNSGYPANMVNKPTNQIGVIYPPSGVIQMLHNKKMTTFTVSATSPNEVTQSYHYVVHLNTNLVPSPQLKQRFKVGENKYSVIEVHGVVRIAQHSQKLLVLEGRPADIIIERMFSTIGTIRVAYHTKSFVGLNAAIPDKDFTPITSYVDFDDGQFKKTIQINIIDDVLNPQPESNKMFYVELKSVVVLSSRKSMTSPRLSPELTATVTIQDNDEPYGIISISEKSRSISVDETSGSVSVEIQRSGGTYSAANVKVLTLGGGETWSDEIISKLSSSAVLQALQRRSKSASSTYDYQPVYTEVAFPESQISPAVRQQRAVTIQILKDNINEPVEEFLVLILNATGGAKLFEPHSFSIISINANGLYNGQVGFQTKTAILDEDGRGYVELVVVRTGQALQNITVTWSASSPVLSDLSEQIMNTSGQTIFPANVKKKTIKIFAKQDVTPEFASWFHVKLSTISSGAVLKEEDSRMTITITESDFPVGKIRFAAQSSYVVIEVGTRSVELIVERENGTLNETTVSYHTVVLAGMVKDGGVTMNPASSGNDFFEANGKVNLAVGQVKALITIRLGDATNVEATYPRVFNVTLSQPTNGAVLHDSYKNARIIITRTGVTGGFLKLRSSALSQPLTDVNIFVLLSRALDTVKRYVLSDNDQQLLLNIITDILNHKASLSTGNRAITSQSRDVLLDIYDALMSNSRTDIKGNSYWIKSLEQAAYSFLHDVSCPTILSFVKSNFEIQVMRNNKSSMNGYTYTEGSNYFKYPENLFLSTSSSTCTDAQFTNLKNRQWFSGEDVLLSDKVLSSSIKSGLGSNNNLKIIYRINAPTNRITPNKVSCVIWQHPTSAKTNGHWSNTNCQVKHETKTYVECECNHLSEYAVLARSDDRTGYEIYFYISCFVTVGACFLALLTHHCCAIEKTFTSNLLMHMFFSVMVTNVLFVIGAYISPDLLGHKTRCGILGLFLHYFFLTQFTNIFVQSCNLWRILIMNDEHTYRKSVPFFLLGWALPVVILIGYIFISYAVWSWKFTMMYADVHGNGDLCFIPHAYAAFSVAAVPVLLILVAVFVVLVQAYQVTPQWKYYDDVFRGRYNIKEVRHLFFLFFLISVTWVFAGLHIAYGYLWMVITFTMLNGLVGLYILVIYVVLRNQMRSMFKGKYSIQQPPPKDRMELRHMAPVESLKHKKKPIGYDDHVNDWANVSISRVSPHPYPNLRTVTPVSQASRHFYTTPTPFGRQGNNNESYEDDEDGNSADFDDLIFALKSGGKYSPSVTEEVIANEQVEENNIPPSSSVSEQFAVRRIQMGDTHL